MTVLVNNPYLDIFISTSAYFVVYPGCLIYYVVIDKGNKQKGILNVIFLFIWQL